MGVELSVSEYVPTGVARQSSKVSLYWQPAIELHFCFVLITKFANCVVQSFVLELCQYGQFSTPPPCQARADGAQSHGISVTAAIMVGFKMFKCFPVPMPTVWK